MLPNSADQHLNLLTGDRRFDEMLLGQIIHPRTVNLANEKVAAFASPTFIPLQSMKCMP